MVAPGQAKGPWTLCRVEPPLLHWTLQKESYMCNTSTTIVSPQADATPNGRS
jgi:hypothetical protein